MLKNWRRRWLVLHRAAFTQFIGLVPDIRRRLKRLGEMRRRHAEAHDAARADDGGEAVGERHQTAHEGEVQERRDDARCTRRGADHHEQPRRLVAAAVFLGEPLGDDAVRGAADEGAEHPARLEPSLEQYGQHGWSTASGKP